MNDWFSARKAQAYRPDGKLDPRAIADLGFTVSSDMIRDLATLKMKYKYKTNEAAIMTDNGSWFALKGFTTYNL